MMTEALANIHVNNNHRKIEREQASSRSLKTNSSTLNILQGKHDFKRGGSFVVGQKLRESKWFTHIETNIFCAVVESGFIIEAENSEYGVAIWAQGFEKSKNPNYLTIYTIQETKGKFKVVACKLSEFWPEKTKVRINNKCDRTETPLAEDVIKNQIDVAETKKKWHNSEHFAYFCRYGPVEILRMRKITEQFRFNTGTFFHKIRRLTAK